MRRRSPSPYWDHPAMWTTSCLHITPSVGDELRRMLKVTHQGQHGLMLIALHSTEAKGDM